MPIKIKRNKGNDLLLSITNIKGSFANSLAGEIVPVILKSIEKGSSPVRGHRWKRYSKSYIAQINGEVSFRMNRNKKPYPITPQLGSDIFLFGDKQPTPVNMKLTGEMLDSLTSKLLRSNLRNPRTGSVLRVFFMDEKAQWHQDGEGKLPVRKLLPIKSGDDFNASIQKDINKSFARALRKEARRRKSNRG